MTDTNTTSTATKKEQVLRVYPITTTDGKTVHVEATNPAAAVLHVHRTQVGRPLAGSAVNALHKAGVKIQTAGEGA